MTAAIAIAVLSGSLVHEGRPVQHSAILLEAPGRTPAPRTARVDEVWLSFVPKVQVVAPGSTLIFAARDADSHTVHGWYRGKTLFNKASVPNGPEQRVVLDGEGIVTFNCELHAQMRAWVVVSSAPFAAVSDAEGKWTVDAPPGRYRVRVWQPGSAAARAGLGARPAAARLAWRAALLAERAAGDGALAGRRAVLVRIGVAVVPARRAAEVAAGGLRRGRLRARARPRRAGGDGASDPDRDRARLRRVPRHRDPAGAADSVLVAEREHAAVVLVEPVGGALL